jgi:hypothetical protein
MQVFVRCPPRTFFPVSSAFTDHSHPPLTIMGRTGVWVGRSAEVWKVREFGKGSPRFNAPPARPPRLLSSLRYPENAEICKELVKTFDLAPSKEEGCRKNLAGGWMCRDTSYCVEVAFIASLLSPSCLPACLTSLFFRPSFPHLTFTYLPSFLHLSSLSPPSILPPFLHPSPPSTV